MSRNALKSIAVFALLCMSTVSVFAQPAATAAQKFSLRNALGQSIMLTAPSSGVTPYVLTFPSTVGSVGQVLALSSTTGGLTWSSVTSGTVTSFSSGDLSPLFTTSVATATTTPALSFSLNSQSQNTVFAAPTGGAGAPTFRLLTTSDIPSGLPYVSSVALGNLSPLFTTTNAGTALAPSFTFSAVSQAANLVYASPTGAPGVPSFRTLTGADVTGAALTKTDDANVTLTLGGSPSTALLNATSLTLGWTGTLATSRGGTGLGSIGTAGQVLRVNAGATGLEYATPTDGTVTNFSAGDLSPLFTTSEATTTTTPALSFNLNTQAANTVFAGPTGGGPVAPTFRGLVANDIPSLPYVSSVALGGLSPLFTTANAGTALAPSFTFAAVSQAANLVYASPSGGPGVPSFRSLTGSDISGAALSDVDDANVTLTLTGAPGSALLNATTITAGWNGQLSIARGGTNASTANDALNNLLPTQTGNAGKILQTDGTNTSWVTPSSGTSDWALTGNSGTTAGTNFLGTTDAVDFVIKTGGSAASNERVRVDASGQVGLGNITPDVMLDVNGAQAWRPGTLDLTIGRTDGGAANSHHDNVSIGDRTYFRVTDTATYYGNTITGFADGYNGKLLRIFNTTNTVLNFSVEDANSTAANRIINTLGNNLSPGIIDSGFADFVYDGTMSRWVITYIGGPISTATSGFTYFGRATADQTLTNATDGTNLVAATGISINILPNIVHTLDGMLYFTSSNSNVDVKLAFDVPNNFNLMKITILGHSDGGANVVDGSDIITADNTASAAINVTGGTEMFVQISGTYINGPSSGPLILKFARAGGSADLVLKQGSYLRLIPVGTN